MFAGLTVAENLRLAERTRSPAYQLVHELFPELRQRAGQLAGTLSGGQQQMVAIGRTLLGGNHLIIAGRAHLQGPGPARGRRGRDRPGARRRGGAGAAGRAEPGAGPPARRRLRGPRRRPHPRTAARRPSSLADAEAARTLLGVGRTAGPEPLGGAIVSGVR